MQPQGTCPRKRAASDHHARTVGGSYISNATASGNHLVKPRRFRNLPIFSLDLTATSAALCIQHPDQRDAHLKLALIQARSKRINSARMSVRKTFLLVARLTPVFFRVFCCGLLFL